MTQAGFRATSHAQGIARAAAAAVGRVVVGVIYEGSEVLVLVLRRLRRLLGRRLKLDLVLHYTPRSLIR